MAKIGGWKRAFAYVPRRVYLTMENGEGVEYGMDCDDLEKVGRRWIWWEEYQRQRYSYWYSDCCGEDWLRREIPGTTAIDPNDGPRTMALFDPMPDITEEEATTISANVEDAEPGRLVIFSRSQWRRLDTEIKRHFRV